MRKKTNRKLYVLAVIPLFAMLYFLTANPLQDDSMWDISTNEYIQRGANFELFALTYEECQNWPDSVQQARNCPSSPSTSSPSTSSSTSSSTGYGSIYNPAPATSWWDNIFTPSSPSSTSSTSSDRPASSGARETSSKSSSSTTNFSCQSNVEMYYKDDDRNKWIKYGSTWTGIMGLELTPKSNSEKGKINEIKGDVYMKCDWTGNGSIKLISATTRTIVSDGFSAGTESYSGQGSNNYVGIAGYNSDMYAEDYDFHLINGYKTKIGEINHITESQLETIESYLNPITYQSSNNCGDNSCVGITFTTTLSPKFVLNDVTKVGITENHLSSMLFTSTLQEAKVVVANQKTSIMNIESITQGNSYENLMGTQNSLDTSIDVSKFDRQIKIISSMRDYDSREGSPTIKLTHGSEVIKITAIKAEKSGDSQRFVTYYSMPIDSTEGTWTVTIENVNRPDMSSSEKFVINNSTPAPLDCNPDKTYQLRDECYTGPDPDAVDQDEVKQLEDLRVGVIWKVKDGGGKTLDQGNSLVDGNSVIPIPQLALISEVVDDRTGSTSKFYQIMIQPIIQFDDKSQNINKYRLAQSYNPLNIPITLSIPDDQSAGTIPKYIQATQTGTGYYKILGTGYMSQADADKLAETAKYGIGDRFTVEAKIGGEFALTSNTNNDYNFKFDDVKISQEFQYGVIGESEDPKKASEDDKKWNDCLEQGKNPSFDNFLGQFTCETDEQIVENECKIRGDSWKDGICIVDVGLEIDPSENEIEKAIKECAELDKQSDSSVRYTWNVGQEICLSETEITNTQPRGDVDDVEIDVDTTNGKIITINDVDLSNLDLDLTDDTTLVVIAIIVAILVVIAIVSRRQNRSYGLMNRYP